MDYQEILRIFNEMLTAEVAVCGDMIEDAIRDIGAEELREYFYRDGVGDTPGMRYIHHVAFMQGVLSTYLMFQSAISNEDDEAITEGLTELELIIGKGDRKNGATMLAIYLPIIMKYIDLVTGYVKQDKELGAIRDKWDKPVTFADIQEG